MQAVPIIKVCSCLHYTVERVIFEALHFRGLLKLKHFADFIFEDRGSFDHNPTTVNNDFEALNFRGSKVNLENHENVVP